MGAIKVQPRTKPKELSQSKEKRPTERCAWLFQEASACGLLQRAWQTQLQKMNPERKVGTRQSGGLVMELEWGGSFFIKSSG